MGIELLGAGVTFHRLPEPDEQSRSLAEPPRLAKALEAVISQRTCAQEFYLQLETLLVITRGSKLTSLEHFWELTSVEN